MATDGVDAADASGQAGDGAVGVDADAAEEPGTCAAPYPHLLDGYPTRPAWAVAGVDACVGLPSGITLKDPTTISEAGVTVDTAEGVILVDGDDVNLDGYDFSGWAVLTRAANTRLVRSKFDGARPNGPQTSVISGSSTASNLYVGASTIDGRPHAEFLVEMEGPGLTVEDSWLSYSNSDIIGRHGADGGEIIIRHNLVEQAGMGGPDTHGDYLQVYGPIVERTVVELNTTIQDGGITQGFICDNTRTGRLASNTMIVRSGMSYLMSVYVDFLTSPFTIEDNHVDVTGAFGFAYGSLGPDDAYPLTLFVHNVDLVTGEVSGDAT